MSNSRSQLVGCACLNIRLDLGDCQLSDRPAFTEASDDWAWYTLAHSRHIPSTVIYDELITRQALDENLFCISCALCLYPVYCIPDPLPPAGTLSLGIHTSILKMVPASERQVSPSYSLRYQLLSNFEKCTDPLCLPLSESQSFIALLKRTLDKRKQSALYLKENEQEQALAVYQLQLKQDFVSFESQLQSEQKQLMSHLMQLHSIVSPKVPANSIDPTCLMGAHQAPTTSQSATSENEKTQKVVESEDDEDVFEMDEFRRRPKTKVQEDVHVVVPERSLTESVTLYSTSVPIRIPFPNSIGSLGSSFVRRQDLEEFDKAQFFGARTFQERPK